MAESKYRIRISSQRKVEPVLFAPTIPPQHNVDPIPQYPHEWFDKTPGTKPSLTIELTMNNLDDVAGVIKKQIRNKSIGADHAKTFLYLWGKTLKGTVDTEWKSYNVVIAKAHTEVTPWSVYAVTESLSAIDDAPDSVAPAEYPGMAMHLLSLYRLIRITNEDYKTKVLMQLNKQLKALGSSDAVALNTGVAIYKRWQVDATYNKLVAGFDMFFTRFPDHKYSNMKVGTVGSRYCDCTSLSSYGYLVKLLGMAHPVDLLDWVFVEKIGDDIERIMNRRDELLDPYSYFPYQVDMGLVQNSAYSATANPSFYKFYHMVGTLLKSHRSMNAKLIVHDIVNMKNITANATIVSYVFSHNFNLQIVKLDLGPKAKLLQALKSRDPNTWFAYIKSCNHTLPKFLVDFYQETVSKIDGVRKGTVAEYLQSSSAQWLFY